MDEFFFDHCPGILVRTDLAGIVHHSNREAQRALGAASLQGKSLQELVHPQDQAEFATRWAEVSTGPEAVRAVSRFNTTDSIQRLAWTAQRAADRDEVHAVFVPLPETKTRLDDPEILLRALLDHCDIGLSVVDHNGIFAVHEGKNLASTGITAGQFVGQSIFDLYESQTPNEIGLLRKTMIDGEPRFWKIDLHNVLWEVSCFAVRDEDGKILGGAFGTIDKSDAKQSLQEVKNKLEFIERQQKVIRNLETPIIQVWDRVLTLPMVGIVDNERAGRVMNDLLEMVVSKGAHYAILDLTGVDTVDTLTAQHLFSMIDAIRLLGAEGIISGIRPTVAQTIVALGLDLSKIKTCANLQMALRLCIRRMMAFNKTSDA